MEKQNTSVIQKLSISYEYSLAIGNSLNLSEMLHDVIHTIVHKTNAHRGSIWLREKEGENIKLGARAGSLLTKAEIKKRVSAFQDIFEKIWKNQQPVIKNRDNKVFFQYCFKITGKEQSVLIVPVKNVAILKLVYTNKEIVNETLANMLLSLSEKLSIAINACLAHDNIKKEIQIRKETEDLLKHSEQQYRSTIDSISKAIHVVDENLSILLFNKTFKQWNKELGFETENLIEKNIFEVLPFLSDTVRDEYQQVFKTGKMLITVETNDIGGRKIITETRKIPLLENNKVVRVVTVIDDITERKQAEEALRNSEEKYKLVTDNITDLVSMCDENGLFSYVSPSYQTILGYKPESIIGLSVHTLVHPDDLPNIKDLIKKKIDRLEDSSAIFRMQHKDGYYLWFESHGRILLDSKGKLKGAVFNTREITERKQAE
ncbi:MAG: PAS domain S-box protein, partial [Candidatus Cloacimonetes bacterium]|nr:PAS domain S-box protein [Candidatus Cloacimonadota bacterium]